MTPSQPRQSDPGRRSLILPSLLAAFVSLAAGAAHAQAVPSPSPAASEITPLERAKRDAEKVFQWIRMHSDKPRRASPPQAGNERAAAVAPVAARRPEPQSAKPSEVADSPPPAAPAERSALTAHTAASQASPAASPAQPVSAALAAASDVTAPIAALPEAPIPEEDVPLVALLQSEPEFPASLMRQLRKGTVQVAFTVQPDGSVTQARSLVATNPRLVRTAIAAVSQWRFQPLRHAQSAVVEVGFNLEE